MRYRIRTKYLFWGMMLGALVACNPWDDQVAINDPSLDEGVLDVLKTHEELSTFVHLLEVTGYDTVLIKSQAYTVFAPTNAAWQDAEVDTTNMTLMRSYVKNHIAFQSNPLTSNAFSTEKIQMLNGKYLHTSGQTIDNVPISEANILFGNGVIHTINSVLKPKMNIWEYLSQDIYSDYPQPKFLKAKTDSTMDMEWSYQLYLDADGSPVYDTVWVQTNEWLSKYGLNDEDSTYAFLLLDHTAFAKLKAKYTPYFTVQKEVYNIDMLDMEMVTDDAATLEQVTGEIVGDMILAPVTLVGGDVALSVGGIKVIIPSGAIDVTYDASNGTIYELSDVDVKLYNNKIKEIIVEGEDYTSSNVVSTIISKRMKSWASSGYDIVLSGRDANNYYALSSQSTTFYTNVVNSYLEYKPTLNSVSYKVYWMSYDDLSDHVTNNVNVPQKLFFSQPNATALAWESGGIYNNFQDTLVFVGQNTAGLFAETPLNMWSTTGTIYRVAKTQLTEQIDFAVDQLPCTSYGESMLWVTNCAFTNSGTLGGSLFLDYIRLVPVMDTDE
jgi:hypothetical protein